MIYVPMVLLCEICGKSTVNVVSSRVGAISCAYCQECIEQGREPWDVLVGGLYGLTSDSVADGVRPTIEATCAFYGKTEAELWAAVQRLEKSYDEYMREREDG